MAQADNKNPNSVKKKKLRHIHFAVIKDTGELVSIDSVQSGLACGCVCAACGKDMKARKGDIRRHHFAHVSNYDCLYGFEIAVYKAVFAVLNKHLKIMLPDAVLEFNSYKKPEIVKEACLQELTGVEYKCEEKQYPPYLACYVGDACMQIIIDFESYYYHDELEGRKKQARDNGAALLLMDMPNVDELCNFDVLEELLMSNTDSKKWLCNRRIDEFHEKYKNAAVAPPSFIGGSICAAQKHQYKNVYSAQWEDCVYCTYCFDAHSENLCLAPSYINHIDDFKKPVGERKKIFEDENKIKRIKTVEEYKCPLCGHSLRLVKGKNGSFAGCSNYPNCKKTYSIEQSTGQLIIP